MFAARRPTPVAVAVALAVLVPVLSPASRAAAQPMFAPTPLAPPPTPYHERIPPSRHYYRPATPLRDHFHRHWRHWTPCHHCYKPGVHYG